MSGEVTLLPCPFCGGDRARTIHIRDGRKVACICGACGKPEFHGPLDRPDAETRAIVAWNARQQAEARATSGAGVPDGWKLVPVEPTEAMLDAWACAGLYRSDQEVNRVWSAMLAAVPEAPGSHADDRAVDLFAAKMKAKLSRAREKGRGGWDDPTQCSPEKLSAMLHEHVVKGDPVDVANFAMMIEHYGASITATEAPGSEGAGWIVGNNVGQWRTFDTFGWAWTDRRDLAVRYARREDAELVHGDDEDSWRVEQYPTRLALNEQGEG